MEMLVDLANRTVKVAICLAVLAACATCWLGLKVGEYRATKAVETRFTDTEERHLDVLSGIAAMELLTGDKSDPDYTAEVRAAYEWASANTSYMGGIKTYSEKEHQRLREEQAP